MKRFSVNALFVIAMLMVAVSAIAQPRDPATRQQWVQEMRQYKQQYMVKELNLSREQQSKFFPLYEEMENAVRKIDDEARAMEERVAQDKDASDTEMLKTAEALYEARVKAAQTECEYMEKFKAILTARQLFELKATERKFSRDMMREHQRLRKNRSQR